jgi:hypothetical protein
MAVAILIGEGEKGGNRRRHVRRRAGPQNAQRAGNTGADFALFLKEHVRTSFQPRSLAALWGCMASAAFADSIMSWV